jgi:hypothetical protein
LSNTFMTDITFTATCTFSCLFFIKAIKSDSDFFTALATVLAIIAILNRQLGLAIPAGFFVAQIFCYGFPLRSVIRAAIPSIICLSAYQGFNVWMESTGRATLDYNFFRDQAMMTFLRKDIILLLLRNCERASLYLGWFLLPLLSLAYTIIARSNPRIAVISAITVAAVSCSLWRTGFNLEKGINLLPLGGNIINRQGIGPFLLRDVYVMRMPHIPPVSEMYWFLITCFGLVGSGLIVSFIVHFLGSQIPRYVEKRVKPEDAAVIFLLATIVIYLIPVMMISWFDRYLVPLVPLGLASISGLMRYYSMVGFAKSTMGARCVAVAVLGVTGFLTVAGSRDYFSWNRIRWETINELVSRDRVNIEDIDGGFEFNLMRAFSENFELIPDRQTAGETERFSIAFGDVPGYSTVKKLPYQNCFPWETRYLFLLEREDLAK